MLLIAFVCLFKNIIYSQNNLIQNSSFEKHSSLSCVGATSSVDNWNGLYSPDYYTANCNNPYKGVPVNDVGVSFAKNGIAYMGFISFIKTMETKEYIYQHLTTSLLKDSIYCLSFYTSRADNIPYAIKNIGAYFSSTMPSMASFPYLSNIPQIINQGGFISDTINWTEIKGCFTAIGGEQYITIGNFNSNANTDTLLVGTTNQLSGANGYAYYYIDSVSLWQNSLPTNVNELGKEDGFLVYPNPTEGKLKLVIQNLKDVEQCIIKMTDMLGREVYTYPPLEGAGGGIFPQSININISPFEKGIYFLSIQQGGKTLGVKKIVKE